MSKERSELFVNVVKVLISTMIGFFGGIILVKAYKYFQEQHSDLGVNLIYYIVGILFLISVFLYVQSIQRYKRMKKGTNLSEDDNFMYQVSLHNKASSNIVNSQSVLLLSFGMSITTLMNKEIKVVLFFILYTVVVAIMLSFINKHNIKVIKEFPYITNTDIEINPKDIHLLDAIIDHLDEGERLIMLHALSKTYRTIIYMLMTILIILSVYQSLTGENQYLAMFGITSILIYSTVVYYKKNEEFNK
ncbi:DUF3169 family protein [Macrococcus equi]|uniref:DUF3169 family protein n=1 Tax=Macrococcus equi TaxID=3395462 RepID=UPI0039BE4556